MKKNFRSSNAAADFFLLQLDANAGDSITNLKMQKLCYYAQAWSLAILGHPVFDSVIEAWAHGPAIPEIYRRFKTYRWDAIDATAIRSQPYSELSSDEIAILEGVWLRYGSLSGTELERLTHSEAPWREAYGDTPIGAKCTAEITHDAMRKYYRHKMPHDDADTATDNPTSFIQSEQRLY